MNTDELYEFVELSSSSEAFNKEQVIALHAYATMLDRGANVVEIGVEYGRSTTVLGFVSKERGLDFTAIDSWQHDDSPQARENVEKVLLGELKLPITLWDMDSVEASFKYVKPIHLIHIDGDHDYDGVVNDINYWTPKVVSGGFIIFDDYGHNSLPDVYRACSNYMTVDKYDFLGRYGMKLGVYKKL